MKAIGIVLGVSLVIFLAGGTFTVGVEMGIKAGYHDGVAAESTYIQGTCESTEGNTQLNGKTYICLTPDQWIAIAKKLKERGV